MFERLRRLIGRRAAGERILRERFADVTGRPLDLVAPHTFTEKLYRRMIELNRRPERRIAQLTDKLAARDHVASHLGSEYLPELHWHGRDPRRLPPELPGPHHVIKANHGCGQVLIPPHELDRDALLQTLGSWLRRDHYWTAREAQYYRLPPRIMVEEYLVEEDGSPALNYRFWCFGKRIAFIKVSDFSHELSAFYDTAWRRVDIDYRDRTAADVPRPRALDKMIDVARELAGEIDFVRLDLYAPADQVYVGEFTFTPRAGALRFQPPEWDVRLGAMWEAPGGG